MLHHRAFYLIAALAGCAAAAELRIDHVTIAGRDLKQMRASFSRAGIRTEYGGKHSNGLTEMALASFADGSYLELIAAQDPRAGAPKHYWGAFIDGDAGPSAWAIGVDDLDSAAKRLGANISTGGRQRPDGVALQWRSAAVGPEPQGTFFPFMIHDVTDRALRADPGGKPTVPEWRGVAEVYIGVRNLDEAVKRYRDTFQLAEPVRAFDKTFGAETARFAGTPVVLAAARRGWLAARVGRFGEAPYAFVIASSGAGNRKPRWLNIPGMRIGVE
jgi:hypothetical protein